MMKELFKRIFGSNKIIDASISAIDSLIFTNEEKAKAKIELLKAYEPYHLALRLIAMIFTIPYVVMSIALIILSM